MSTNILLVKNMVCHRCVLAVESIMKNAGIPFQEIQIGEIHLAQELTDHQYEQIRTGLAIIGLELIDNRTGSLIEKIKQLVIKKARTEVDEKERKLNLSAYLSQKLYHEYTYLSSLFSSVEGRTIENYFIQQRIEKVKELLVYNEMTLSDIAFELDYSSTAHLSSQFKQITGLTPSHFRKVGSLKRQLIDKV
ncbi:MAG TPA: helix-turn-helix transcriptional regulator [Flavisolibacter sp.]|jgi:AraC-like DNA-binding protein|nr:helix-turn-helix transcriptional regulator [Flavisolibacter sp.]